MSFEEFVDDWLPRLLRLTGALTGDRYLAEDLVQEVLVRVHRDWERIAASDLPDAYVRRMLVNEYVSWRRRWARMIPHPDPDPGGQEPDPADRIAERDALSRRLRRLPRKQRAVVALRYYAGLSDTDIADTLGCSTGTVRAHASRALATLRVDGADVTDPSPLTRLREETP